MVKKLIVVSALFMFLGSNAQNTHTVAKGDNPYSISRKYGMTLDELYRLNPDVKNNTLNIGEVLNIKNKAIGEKSPAKSEGSKVGKIVLQPKQTLYSITKQYHITEEEVRKLNPNLQMQIGEEVFLPVDKISKYADANANTVVSSTPVEQNTLTNDNSYEVQPKDNYYRISKKFGISQKELLALNPGLEERGLQAGDIIKVRNAGAEEAPAKKGGVAVETATTNPEPETKTYDKVATKGDYITYTVQAGDTVFGILNQFEISFDQLLELNPQLRNGLKTGMILKIKKIASSYVKTSGDALNVSIMLPFGFSSQDSKYRNIALDFLTGAKMAVERNAKAGKKINLKIIDSGAENVFQKSLSKIDKDQTDLIIGPLFKSNVIETLKYVDDKKIPVVAPFANTEELYEYSNLVMVETAHEVYYKRIAKEVKEVYNKQKIYLLAGTDRADANALKKELQANIKDADVVIVGSALDIKLENNMVTGKPAPVITVLTSDQDSYGSQYANHLIELSKEVSGIHAFSMYYNPIFEKKVDELSQVNLVYLMDRKIDTDGSFEKEILADYKQKYCKTPSKYAIIGFDVVNDMLMRENSRAELFKQIGKSQTQLATKFEFVQVKPGGAYVNTGYRVVRLLPQ